MDQTTNDFKAADTAMPSPSNGESDPSVKRAIEVGFPIVEINRLAVPERKSFKPIYQMHKWFARRASCVFRTILLGVLKPAVRPDNSQTDLMAEFYKDHTNDLDTKDKVILDPFMGGGTTIVEALRLGCRVVGVDLNPVAWFIVKTEIEPTDVKALNESFTRLAERPVEWNGGRSLEDSLLSLYKTEVADGVQADVVYTFWVKSAICTDLNCRREVPLFKDYIIAYKAPKIRYHRDAICPACRNTFDWEVELASMIADQALMINAPRGSGGEGRPAAFWSFAVEPPKPRGRGSLWQTDVVCPRCQRTVRMQVPSATKQRKSVALSVLLCPSCETVWQWRGTLPYGEVNCPACHHSYDPRIGNVPQKGKFKCSCGQQDEIIASIRLLPRTERLPIRPYAVQAYLRLEDEQAVDPNLGQATFFDEGKGAMIEGAHNGGNVNIRNSIKATGLLVPGNGKFFKRFNVSDMRHLQHIEALWEKKKESLPYPKSSIPSGEKTKSGLIAHHYNNWHEMFSSRQLLGLATILRGIMAEANQPLKEMLLSGFFSTLEGSNMFARFKQNQNRSETAKGVFARHDFQPKLTPVEDNVWGADTGKGFRAWFEIVVAGKEFAQSPSDNYYNATRNGYQLERRIDGSSAVSTISDSLNGNARAVLQCQSLLDSPKVKQLNHVITDPPYVGNVNYSELADFFYVWLRLALKEKYTEFAPDYTPKVNEIIENRSRGKTRKHFFDDLLAAFTSLQSQIANDGLLVFTFHHTDQKGLVWEGLLESLCEAGFELIAVYPIHGESESSTHLQDKENISYDLIHVCRKRKDDTLQRSWAAIRIEVRRRARDELRAIEEGRYGREPLAEPDVRLICIGKCLELYSAHYGKVLDHKNMPLPLHKALLDISVIVDQLVTKDRPLPAELDVVDGLSQVWLKVLATIRNEITVDTVSKALRGTQVKVEDLKEAGLLVRGRAGRGRTYEVKQPAQRLADLLKEYQPGLKLRVTQGELFTSGGEAIFYEITLVDLLHLVLGLAIAGESVVPWLERFAGLRAQLGAALRFVRDSRADWKEPIDRVLALIEGAPLIRQIEEA